MSTLPEDKEQYIEGSRKLITLLGSKKLCELGHFSPTKSETSDSNRSA